MTNAELSKTMQDFVDSKNDTDKDEWWGTEKSLVGGVIDDFVDYLRQSGIRITLPNKEQS